MKVKEATALWERRKSAAELKLSEELKRPVEQRWDEL